MINDNYDSDDEQDQKWFLVEGGRVGSFEQIADSAEWGEEEAAAGLRDAGRRGGGGDGQDGQQVVEEEEKKKKDAR